MDECKMRLSSQQVQIIRDITTNELGPSAEVILFGSRVDDSAKGGDVDLMVTVPEHMERPSWRAARLAARLERKMDGRHVDVVLVTHGMALQAIHTIARQQGVRL
uniref:Nucleotidyltransferase domain-containing protein n=1 Tax=Candidatus Kentrum sp. DK TaxID=2126562 RepID=A0A450T6X9_9GAMM|nr:MAG: Nucleotidyltransferase domain-containing protein [Candidatus Kentron sp. DK]